MKCFNQLFLVKRLSNFGAFLLIAISVTTLNGCNGADGQAENVTNNSCVEMKGVTLRGRFLHLQTNPEVGEFPVFQLPTDSTTVNYTLGDMQPKQAIFSCQEDGTFHIVDSLAPTILIAESSPNKIMEFQDLMLPSSPGLFTFSIVGEDQATCTQEYVPVCAVAPLTEDDFCDTDCPFGNSKTYGNACTAEANGALIYKMGDCGDDEGNVYTL